MNRKIKAIILVWSLTLPLAISESLAHTAFYRDVFHYADAAVVNTILNTGHVSYTPGIDPFYWAKVRTRVNQPVLPIFLSMGKLVTDLSPQIFQTRIPIYSSVLGMYYVIVREFTSSNTAIVISIAGAISPNMSPMTAPGGRAIKFTVLLLVLYFAIRYEDWKDSKIFGSVGMSIMMFHLLYNYPRLFVEAAFFAFFLGGTYLWRGRSDMVAPVGIALSGLWIILVTPFQSYTNVLSYISARLGNLAFLASNPTEPTALLEMPSYSIETVPPLLFFGMVGGVISLKVVSFGGRNRHKHLILVLWGVAILMFAIAQLATGKAWLIIRMYGTALPLMLVASGIGIHLLSQISVTWEYVTKVGMILIVATMFLSYITMAGSVWVDIHTYSQSEVSSANWTNNLPEDSSVGSDMKHSALLVGQKLNPKYPDTPQDIKNMFYSGPSEFRSATKSLELDYFIISESMSESGLYIRPHPRQPASPYWIKERERQNEKIYDNGDEFLIMTGNASVQNTNQNNND